MPEQPQYPIDDNTLFILLALRYQGEIEIDGLDSVYDDVVNYSYTQIKQNKDKQKISEIADDGIKWIIETFGAEKTMDKGGKITITLEDSNDLRTYLEEYLREFVSYKNYYLDEEAHKENFCDYIKKRFRDIVEYRKSFAYSFIQNKQYKMIEYIAYLMNHKILSITCDDDIFTFDLDGDDKISKVIQLKFTDEYDIQKFIAQGRKYQKGIFYTYENDNNVYFNRGEHRIVISSVDYILKFLRLCIIKNLNEVKLHSYKKLMNNSTISDKSVMNYYGKLNCDLKDLTLNKEHEFFCRIRSGIWKLNFDL